MKEMKIRITLTNEMLGTAPSNPDTYREWIMSKCQEAGKDVSDELEAVKRAYIENEDLKIDALTVFPRNAEGKPIIFDYQIRGFFKEACSSLRQMKDEDCAKNSCALKNYKKAIDGSVFCVDREMEIHLPEGGQFGLCQRSLRAQTMQGERITISSSESVPAGSWIDCTIQVFEGTVFMDKHIKEWLDYGKFKGLLQWRSGGKGSFTWEEIK